MYLTNIHDTYIILYFYFKSNLLTLIIVLLITLALILLLFIGKNTGFSEQYLLNAITYKSCISCEKVLTLSLQPLLQVIFPMASFLLCTVIHYQVFFRMPHRKKKKWNPYTITALSVCISARMPVSALYLANAWTYQIDL